MVMDTKEKHVRENEGRESREARYDAERHEPSDMIAGSLPAEGRERKRKDTKKINNLWLWFGVLILIAILLYWLFSIGIMEDLMNVFNG